MTNLRKYGDAPYTVAVLHGGPGAPGQMAPVARRLAFDHGVLEPLQTASSIDGQVDELRAVLDEYGDLPVTLIGSSWGAWLGFIFAARYPDYAGKLILVGSGPFEERYAAGITDTRMSRLTLSERALALTLLEILDDPDSSDRNRVLAQLGELFTETDAYDPRTLDTETIAVDYDIHCSIWTEASELRRNGGLLELANDIRCPVMAIHGDYDPHPAEGVRKPLMRILPDFRFILLHECGHLPWIERRAREEFFGILRDELA